MPHLPDFNFSSIRSWFNKINRGTPKQAGPKSRRQDAVSEVARNSIKSSQDPQNPASPAPLPNKQWGRIHKSGSGDNAIFVTVDQAMLDRLGINAEGLSTPEDNQPLPDLTKKIKLELEQQARDKVFVIANKGNIQIKDTSKEIQQKHPDLVKLALIQDPLNILHVKDIEQLTPEDFKKAFLKDKFNADVWKLAKTHPHQFQEIALSLIEEGEIRLEKVPNAKVKIEYLKKNPSEISNNPHEAMGILKQVIKESPELIQHAHINTQILIMQRSVKEERFTSSKEDWCPPLKDLLQHATPEAQKKFILDYKTLERTVAEYMPSLPVPVQCECIDAKKAYLQYASTKARDEVLRTQPSWLEHASIEFQKQAIQDPAKLRFAAMQVKLTHLPEPEQLEIVNTNHSYLKFALPKVQQEVLKQNSSLLQHASIPEKIAFIQEDVNRFKSADAQSQLEFLKARPEQIPNLLQFAEHSVQEKISEIPANFQYTSEEFQRETFLEEKAPIQHQLFSSASEKIQIELLTQSPESLHDEMADSVQRAVLDAVLKTKPSILSKAKKTIQREVAEKDLSLLKHASDKIQEELFFVDPTNIQFVDPTNQFDILYENVKDDILYENVRASTKRSNMPKPETYFHLALPENQERIIAIKHELVVYAEPNLKARILKEHPDYMPA